jgi:hypothetical protein
MAVGGGCGGSPGGAGRGAGVGAGAALSRGSGREYGLLPCSPIGIKLRKSQKWG